MQEMKVMQVESLGWEDPLEEKMATPPGLLLEKFHGERNLVGYSPWGHIELYPTEWLRKSTVSGFPKQRFKLDSI